MTSSTAFYVHLPNRERGKGHRLNDVTLSLLLSVLYIFVTSLTMFKSYSTYGPWISVQFYYVYPAVKCRSVPTVLRFSDDWLNI